MLEGIASAERPDVFNRDFLGSVLSITGGSAAATLPILKSTGFLSSDSSPTEIYSRFQTESGRANAALDALKKGYADVFRKNKFANKLDDGALKDLLVEITGLKKSDTVITSICGTMRAFLDYAKDASLTKTPENGTHTRDESTDKNNAPPNNSSNIGLIYNVNIVLPETTNIEVYNTIFRSLKSNLLQ